MDEPVPALGAEGAAGFVVALEETLPGDIVEECAAPEEAAAPTEDVADCAP